MCFRWLGKGANCVFRNVFSMKIFKIWSLQDFFKRFLLAQDSNEHLNRIFLFIYFFIFYIPPKTTTTTATAGSTKAKAF